MKPVLLLTMFSVCASACGADELKILRPFLWKVDGIPTESGTTKHAYLFGTIHVPDTALTTMHPTAQAAWEEAGAVYFEIDFLKDAPAQMEAIALPDGKKLDELVSEDLVKRVDDRLKKISPLMTRGGVLPEAHVIMWPILLETLEAQVGGGMPMDMQLYGDAMGRGRVIGGLEDASKQLKPLTDLPIEKQTEFLKASLDQMDKDDEDEESDTLTTLKTLYASGDEKKFQENFESEMDNMDVSPELQKLFKKTLLGDRNVRMADAIVDRMKKTPEKVCFFAVGCGHLIGDDSVQVHLKKKSVNSARVPEPKNEADEKDNEIQ